MKKTALRLTTVVLAVVLLISLAIIPATASSDFYESTYKYYYYCCRSYLTESYVSGKIECANSSYLLEAFVNLTYSAFGEENVTGVQAISFSSATASKTAAEYITFLLAQYRYSADGPIVYTIELVS